MPDSMTQILSSGPPGIKVKIAVMGDGFADGADQTAVALPITGSPLKFFGVIF